MNHLTGYPKYNLFDTGARAPIVEDRQSILAGFRQKMSNRQFQIAFACSLLALISIVIAIVIASSSR